MSKWVDVVAKSQKDSWVPSNMKEYIRQEGTVIVAYCSVLVKDTGDVHRTLQYRITTDEYDWYSDMDYEDVAHLHGFDKAQGLEKYYQLEETDVDVVAYVGHYYDAVLWIPQNEYYSIKDKLLPDHKGDVSQRPGKKA